MQENPFLQLRGHFKIGLTNHIQLIAKKNLYDKMLSN
jgi:hypothetical protein